MKSTKAYSKGLKELRLKLGIKPPSPRVGIETRAAELKQRVEWVVRKSKNAQKFANRETRGPLYRWTQEEDQKLLKLRSSGKKWQLIAKELHRSSRSVRYRFFRLLQKRSWP